MRKHNGKVYIEETKHDFDALKEIVAILRSPNGCSWDREQTFESMRECLTNEAGEVIGVLVAGIDSAKGMNYAIPINMVKKFINYVIENTDLSRRSLAELANVKNSPSDMAFGTGMLFSGIRLVLDVVQYIIGCFH